MAIQVSLGALTFSLHAAMVATPPAFATRPLLNTGDAAVATVEESGRRWLVVDHRREPEASRSARIEFWAPSFAGEAGVEGLLVIADPAHDCPSWRPVSIAELTSRITA